MSNLNDRRREGYWPGDYSGQQSSASATPLDPSVVSGNQLIPNVATATTPNGTGVGILAQTFRRIEPRILTLGIPGANPTTGSQFPVPIFNGNAFASCCGGLVNTSGVAIALTHPYLACVLEYGSGSAAQKCWMDWYQGSYNLPACEFVRVSALPWGTWWNLFPLNTFNAVASVTPGQIQGAHVPSITAVGAFSAGVQQSVSTPANARAVEVTAVDPSVATTVTISGAAAGTRNLSTGALSPGWTPLELELGVSAVGITSSADANLRVQFFMQL